MNKVASTVATSFIRALTSPRSVAIIGASQKLNRATKVVQNLVEFGYQGSIFPINEKYSEVIGIKCFPCVADVPEPIDVAVLGIPVEAVVPALRECHAAGIRAAVILASGFAEAGPPGLAHQEALASFAAETGMLLCGPNCLGIVSHENRFCGYSAVLPKMSGDGVVAVASQSGSIAIAINKSPRDFDFSYLVSSGNEVGLSISDYLDHFLRDEKTRVAGAFIETLKDPAKFQTVAREAYAARKPIVVLKTGRSRMGEAASVAHTGGLVGSFKAHEALFRQIGVVQCQDIDEWFDCLEIFRFAKAPRSRGLGLIGVSGGENALVLDHAEELGLDVPSLSAAGEQRLRTMLPWFTRPTNPIDPTGDLGKDPSFFARYLDVLADEPDVGIVVVSQDSPAVFDQLVVQAMVEAAARTQKQFVFLNNISVPLRKDLQDMLHAAGIPVVLGLRTGMTAIRRMIDYHLPQHQIASRSSESADKAAPADGLRLVRSAGRVLNEVNSKRLLAIHGMRAVGETIVSSEEAAVVAATEFGFPVVAKVISADIAHKASIGGVRLGLYDAEAVRLAYREVLRNAGLSCPDGKIDGVLIQPMVDRGVELLFGIKKDAQLGNVVVFGLGGVWVEAMKQVSMRLAPLTSADARKMIEEVGAVHEIIKKLGNSDAIIDQIVGYLLGLSDIASIEEYAIEEIDINPAILNVERQAIDIVDALVVRQSEPEFA